MGCGHCSRSSGFCRFSVCRKAGTRAPVIRMYGYPGRGSAGRPSPDGGSAQTGRGRFRFIAFPLKIRGGTGSPVRAVAVIE